MGHPRGADRRVSHGDAAAQLALLRLIPWRLALAQPEAEPDLGTIYHYSHYSKHLIFDQLTQ